MSNPTPGARPLPMLSLGTEVEVCQDETMGIPHFGRVVATNDGRRPNILLEEVNDTELNFVAMKHCLHVDDPELPEKADEIRQRSDRGVFRLAPRELLLRKLAEEYPEVAAELSRLNKEVIELRGSVAVMHDLVEKMRGALVKLKFMDAQGNPTPKATARRSA